MQAYEGWDCDAFNLTAGQTLLIMQLGNGDDAAHPTFLREPILFIENTTFLSITICIYVSGRYFDKCYMHLKIGQTLFKSVTSWEKKSFETHFILLWRKKKRKTFIGRESPLNTALTKSNAAEIYNKIRY